MQVDSLVVSIAQENTYIVRRDGSDRALLIDPGDDPDRIMAELDRIEAKVDAILVTHGHFDHIGAVAPMARHTGAEVWMPKIERPLLEHIMDYIPYAGVGQFEDYVAEHDVSGGERLELAGFEIDVIFTPGHSPGHVTYSIADELAIFSGDVLFQSSIGRTDLPGGDMRTLIASIETLMLALPPETTVFPGHMGTTTLGQEQRTNPFLRGIAPA